MSASLQALSIRWRVPSIHSSAELVRDVPILGSRRSAGLLGHRCKRHTKREWHHGTFIAVYTKLARDFLDQRRSKTSESDSLDRELTFVQELRSEPIS